MRSGASETASRERLSRRRLLRTGAVAALASSSAGCLLGGDERGSLSGGSGEGTDSPTTEKPTRQLDAEKLEVVHDRNSGAGAKAMAAVTTVFEARHPEIPVNSREIGPGDPSYDLWIEERLEDDDPPGSFASWPGANLQRFADFLGDCEDTVWETDGLKRAHVSEVKQAAQFGGQWVAVPLGSHRLNNLFYNVELVERAGVDPDSITDPPGLLDAFDAVRTETDAVPFAHAMNAPWTNLQLFATTLLGQEGDESYRAFVDGDETVTDAVERTLQTMKPILESHLSSDASRLRLAKANQKLIDGDAAFVHQGNWVYDSYRATESFDHREDWDWIPFPGTAGRYLMHLHAFVYPAGDPTPDKTPLWLRFVGSEAGQRAFNERKGAVPTRTDVATDDFPEYLTTVYDDFRTAEHRPPTITHGLAVGPGTLRDLKKVFAEHFMDPFDVERTTQGLVGALP